MGKLFSTYRVSKAPCVLCVRVRHVLAFLLALHNSAKTENKKPSSSSYNIKGRGFCLRTACLRTACSRACHAREIYRWELRTAERLKTGRNALQEQVSQMIARASLTTAIAQQGAWLSKKSTYADLTTVSSTYARRPDNYHSAIAQQGER